MVTYVDLARNPRGVTIIAVLWTMVFLSGVFLGLRLYSKITRTRHVWWDDYFIVAAWVLLVVSCSSTTANARLGFGLHMHEVPFENIIPFGIQSNISGFTSIIAVACSKTSFAITLLRLSDGRVKWFIIGLLVVLNITHYLSALFFWVSCDPPAKTWNPLLPGDCWPVSVTVNYSLFVGACSALSDFALAVLPWRLLLRFNMYNREKIGVAICMSMGIFAGISCIIKMTTIPLLYDGDFSYNSLPLVLWGFIEPSITVIAASIPVMRHLFRFFRRDQDGTLPSMSRSADPTASVGGAAAATAGGPSHANAAAADGTTAPPEKAARGNYQLQRQQMEEAAAAAAAAQASEADGGRGKGGLERLASWEKESRSDSSILAKQAAAEAVSTSYVGESRVKKG